MNRKTFFAAAAALLAVSASAQTIDWNHDAVSQCRALLAHADAAPAAKPVTPSVAQSPRLYASAIDSAKLPFSMALYNQGALTVKSSAAISPWDGKVIVSLKICDNSYHDPKEDAPDCLTSLFGFDAKQLTVDSKGMVVRQGTVKVASLTDAGRFLDLEWLPGYSVGYEVGADGVVTVFLKQ